MTKHLAVYQHVPKTGGGEVKLLLHRFFSREIANKVIEIRNEVYPSRTQASDQRTKFVISNAREPCDHYVSSYKYGIAYDRDHFPNSARAKWDPLNRTQFYEFYLKPILGSTHFFVDSEKLTHKYRQYLPGWPVDCWIRTNRLYADFTRCFTTFANKTGSKIEKVIGDWFPTNRTKVVHQTRKTVCSSYFRSPGLAERVLKADAAVYRQFPDFRCCGGLTCGADCTEAYA